MPGRFAFYSPNETVAARFGVDDAVAIEPRYNIAPTQYVASIRYNDEQKKELALLRWGLVPSWAKDPSVGSRMINARAETIAEKPSFRQAYRKQRCLILADGFYEWHREGDTKVPYFISLANGHSFAFAGLWERWQSRDSDEALNTATIVTTAANAFLSRLHQRMPVVLEPANAQRWLDGDMRLPGELSVGSASFRAWPVDAKVNNVRNELPQLIDAVGATIS